ncbi:MFS transporter [Jidongwangia harbinensis]|uniref:MFS transporter n=1 Tax=Jidongwangia harbinensis TaxID=2878561 RepID=UPI001CD93A3C|nr:MFS transporter [Jidongwangia harbinensis]MCA2211703.1 MFS transporter [Jidongwangia harbinensis]
MSAFAHPAFRRLYVGDALSGFGDTALLLALGVWVKDLTGSTSAAGLVFLAMGAPALIAPLAGRHIDRVRRKPLLMATNGVAMLAVLCLLLVRSAEQIWLIYLVAVGYGCVFTLVSAIRGALLKDLLPDAELASANAAFGTLGGVTRILAPLAGAAIYATAGAHALVVLDAVTFLGAIAALATVRLTESSPDPATVPFAEEVLAGFRFIRSVPLLSAVTAVSAVAFGAVGFLEPTIFAVIQHGLDRPPSFFGMLASAQGCGAVLAGLVGARLLRHLGEARTIGGALLGIALGSGLLIVGSTPVVVAACTGIGASVTWFAIGWNTALQRHSPARLLGRVFTTAGMLVTVPQTAAIGLAAGLVMVLDYRVLLVVVAVAVAGCGLLLLIRPGPEPVVLPAGSGPPIEDADEPVPTPRGATS